MIWGHAQSAFQLGAAYYLASSFFLPAARNKYEKARDQVEFAKSHLNEVHQYASAYYLLCDNQHQLFPNGIGEVYELLHNARIRFVELDWDLRGHDFNVKFDAELVQAANMLGLFISCAFLIISIVGSEVHLTRWLFCVSVGIIILPFVAVYVFYLKRSRKLSYVESEAWLAIGALARVFRDDQFDALVKASVKDRLRKMDESAASEPLA